MSTAAAASSVVVACDGCGAATSLVDLRVQVVHGNEGRFCPSCYEHYQAFVTACLAEETRMNRLLDLFIADARARLPLRLIPQDRPARVRSTPLVLG